MNETIQNDLEQRLEDKDFAEKYGESIAKSEIAVMMTQARQSRKITQEDLAKKLGINQSYIAKLESGDANPTVGNIGKLLANMGLRLIAEVGELDSKIGEKRVRNYSTSANNLYTWTTQAVYDEFQAAKKWSVPIDVIIRDEDTHGMAGLGLYKIGSSNSMINFDTIWESYNKENDDSLILRR